MAWIKGRDYINEPYENDKPQRMKKHTNLPNEITGEYYNSKFDWSVAIAMGVVTVVTGVIYWLAF